MNLAPAGFDEAGPLVLARDERIVWLRNLPGTPQHIFSHGIVARCAWPRVWLRESRGLPEHVVDIVEDRAIPALGCIEHTDCRADRGLRLACQAASGYRYGLLVRTPMYPQGCVYLAATVVAGFGGWSAYTPLNAVRARTALPFARPVRVTPPFGPALQHVQVWAPGCAPETWQAA